MRKIIFAIFAMSLFSNNVFAFQWGSPVKITGVYIYANGNAHMKTEANQNPDNCSGGAVYLTIESSSQNFKQLYATALAAQASGQTVSINYNGCTGPYPTVNSIAIPAVW